MLMCTCTPLLYAVGCTRRLVGGSVLDSIEVGRVEITALTDMEGAFFGLDQIFPGVAPDDVDTVFLTHLHGDHLGWSVRPDGEPVFPEARYVTQAAEWEISAPYLGRAIARLDERGVLELLDGEEPVGEELTAIPTPGHSPGHNSLLVSSQGQQALVSGDAIVHPAQATEPTWNVHFDMDKEQAARTREMLLAWLEADGIVVAAGHIPGSGFGRIARDAGGRYWQTLEKSREADLPGIDLSRGGRS